jgi:hypothetical protein
MNRLLNHLRANVIAYLALFVALGGTSYAAFSLPAGSVGTSQLRNGSITPIKFNAGKVGAYVRAWAVIQGGTKVIAASPRARILDWDPGSALGDISWGSAILSRCFVLSSGGGDNVQSVVRAHFRGVGAVVHFGVSSPSGEPDASSASIAVLTVLCPE